MHKTTSDLPPVLKVQATIDNLNAADLIILVHSRSGDYKDNNKLYWNTKITAPLMIIKPWLAKKDRLKKAYDDLFSNSGY